MGSVETVIDLPPAALEERLARAIWAAKIIPKDRRNSEQGYDYASSDAIIGEARSLLAEQGVSASWRLENHELDDAGLLDSAKGAGFISIDVRLWSAGGNRTDGIRWPIVIGQRRDGGALRPLDKAIKGAITTAMGEYFRGLLCLDRGAPDEETDARPEPVQQARRDNQQRQAQRPKTQPQTERRSVLAPVGQPASRRDEGSGLSDDEPPPPTEPPFGEPPGEAPDLPPPDPQVGRLAREGLLGKLRETVRVVGNGAAAELLKRAGFGELKELKEYPTPRLVDALTILTRSVEEREAAQRMLEEQREQAAAEQQRRLEAAVAKTTEHKERVDFEARAAAMAAKGRGAA